MKENCYDNQSFFDKYRAMARSQKGLMGAGEWPTLKIMLPDFKNKEVIEPQPAAEMANTIPGMNDELRRPMILAISVTK